MQPKKKRRLNDEERFKAFMRSIDLHVYYIDKPEFLHDYELYKQDKAYMLDQSASIEFNFKNGKYIGFNTPFRNSFIARDEKGRK